MTSTNNNSSNLFSPQNPNQTEYDLLNGIAQRILRTPGFSVLLFIEVIFGIFAATANLLLAYCVCRVGVFHVNLRILLAHLSLALAACSLTYAIKAITYLPTVLCHSDVDAHSADHFIVNMYECRLTEIPNSIVSQAAIYAQWAITIERLYSTLKFRRYDDDQHAKSFWISLSLLPISYVIPVANLINSLVRTPRNQLIAVCENLLSTTVSAAQQALIINVSVLVIGSIGVIVLCYWNVIKLRDAMINRTNHTLASRFQIEQNIHVNKILLPSMIMQCMCYFPNYVFLFLIVIGLPLSHETKTILIHVNYAWKIMYASAHVFFAFSYNKHTRRKAIELLPKNLATILMSAKKQFKNNAIGISGQQQENGGRAGGDNKIRLTNEKVHFEMLDEAWNKPSSKSKPKI